TAPEGRLAVTRRWSTTNNALLMIARVSAICAAMRMAPVLLRNRAERMGRISMGAPGTRLEVIRRKAPDQQCCLLALELHGRANLTGAPGGQQPRQQRT